MDKVWKDPKTENSYYVQFTVSADGGYEAFLYVSKLVKKLDKEAKRGKLGKHIKSCWISAP